MRLNLSTLAVPVVPVKEKQQREPVDQAQTIATQGLQPSVPVVPVVPVQKGKLYTYTEKTEREPAANDAGPVPHDLAMLVSKVATLEGWPQDLQAEHVAIIARQLACGEFDAATIARGWQAHLARWHTPPGDGSPVAASTPATLPDNDCMSCRYWLGVLPYHEQRNTARQAAGLDDKPRSAVMGCCAKHHRPWRVSNVAGSAAYGCWHFLGHCNREGTP